MISLCFADARSYQILFLSLFLGVGWMTRDWALQPGMSLTGILSCMIAQGLLIGIWQPWLKQPDRTDNLPSLLSHYLHGLPSALITGLSLSLLLRTEHYGTMLLASVFAIASKFLCQFRGKHLFNPANFGIVATLLLTNDTWVSPAQWGESGWYLLLFLATGGLVLQRVGRWDTSVAFLVTYAGLEALRNYWLGWSGDVWMHRLMSGSLLVFALFMITDPRTIPNARVGRLIWAMAIAGVSFILRNYFYLSTAVIWALFLLAPLAVLLDHVFPAERFVWEKPMLPATPVPAASVASSQVV